MTFIDDEASNPNGEFAVLKNIEETSRMTSDRLCLFWRSQYDIVDAIFDVLRAVYVQ